MSERLRYIYDRLAKKDLENLSTYDQFLRDVKNDPDKTMPFMYRSLSTKVKNKHFATYESFTAVILPDINNLPDKIENRTIQPFHKSPSITVPGVFDTQTVEPEGTLTQKPVDVDITKTYATTQQPPVPAKDIVAKDFAPPVSPAAGLPIPRSKPPEVKEFTFDTIDTEIREPVKEVWQGLSNTYQRAKYQDRLSKKLTDQWSTGKIDGKTRKELFNQHRYTYEEITAPLMNSLQPIPGNHTLNVAKELATLAIIKPHIWGNIASDVASGDIFATRTLKSVAEFYGEVYSNWVDAVAPRTDTQQREAWGKIIEQPVFHSLGLLLPYGLWAKGKIKTDAPPPTNILGVKTMPRDLKKFVAETKGKEIVNFVLKNPNKANNIITKASEGINSGVIPKIETVVVFPKNPREAVKASTTPAMIEGVGQIPKNLKDVKTAGAKRMELHFNAADLEASLLGKTSFTKIKEDLITKTVDIAGNVKKQLIEKGGEAGKIAVIYKDTIAGTSARAALLTKKYSDRIYGGLRKSERQQLDNIIRSRRLIEIEGYKPNYNPGAYIRRGDAKEYLDSVSKNVTDKLNVRAETYFEIMRSELGRLVKEGVIEPNTYRELLKYQYEPTLWLDKINPEVTFKVGGETRTLRESGIKNLKEGMDSVPVKDSQYLLERTVAITDARIANNKANRALYDLANIVPNNNIVRKAERIHPGTTQYKLPPPGYTNLPVRIDGKIKEFYMRNDMALEWTANRNRSDIANQIGFWSGSNLLKPMATGFNPEFALTNFPRDLAHIWFTTKEYSSFAPKFLSQIGKDLITVSPDVIARKGRYVDYVMEGGGMNFLTHQGLQTKTIQKQFNIGGTKIAPLKKLGEVFGYLGETTELWTRLALRERALRNGKSNVEATWIARNYLDFSQGGSLIKAADVAIPYLNAAIQGTRGVLRAFKNDPALAMYKTSQVGAISAGLYMANRTVNEEAYNSISTRDKVNNWIITTPLYEVDDEGHKRYYYLKIAKDQSQRIFATGVESLVAKSFYNEDPPDEMFQMAAEDAIPIGWNSLPPSVDAAIGYMYNKDFWRNEDIWKGGELPPDAQGLEYTPKTHPFFVKVGEKFPTISPVRLQYSLSQFTTNSNIYTDIVGGGYKALFNELPSAEKDKTMKGIIEEKPFIRKVFKKTPPPYIYKEAEIARQNENFNKRIINEEFDKLTEQFYNGFSTKKPINDFINKQSDIHTKKRLRERMREENYLQKREYKKLWRSLSDQGLNPESTAKVYMAYYLKLDPQLQNLHEKDRKKTFGAIKSAVNSRRFNIELRRLMEEAKK